MAAAKEIWLESDVGVFDAGDDAVGTDPDEGDDGGTPAFDFGFEALGAGAKFVGCEFIGAGSGAFDDVRDAEFEVEETSILKRREEAGGEAGSIKGRPEAVAGSAEVTADGRCVETGVNAGEKHDQVFGDEIRNEFIVRRQELGLGGLPRGGQNWIHKSALRGQPFQAFFSRGMNPGMPVSTTALNLTRVVIPSLISRMAS